MNTHIEEASYPLTFRNNDSQILGNYIKNRNSVVLIGMKRVGISNFLRFFLNKKGVQEKYIDNSQNHLFIPIDLNDLVERELHPFWVLTLKRIEDAVLNSKVDEKTKKYIETLFLDSIQSQDLFLTIDSIRKSLSKLVEANITPTIFFLRFDRIKDVVTPEFFANLQGLVDASHRNLSYVFTSVRSLEFLSPSVFTRASVSAFARTLYVSPNTHDDAKVILNELMKKYGLNLTKNEINEILTIVDGYTQYLQLALSYLNEKKENSVTKNLIEELYQDERIGLQSEELWESLEDVEKEILIKIVNDKSVTQDDRDKASYLWNTGIVKENKVFSSLFRKYVDEKGSSQKVSVKHELSRKENLLLKILEENRGALCEREHIIEYVWPEAESYGVSDWAVDRLVARLRGKLKASKSNLEVITVKTRGYKLA